MRPRGCSTDGCDSRIEGGFDASLVTQDQSIVSAVKLVRFFSSAAASAAIPLLTVAACGGDDDAQAIGAPDAAVSEVSRLDGPIQLQGTKCPVTVDSPPFMPTANHKDEATPIEWSSNPPSSGDHFGQWATFREFQSVVPRGFLVHSMEHGAVLLLYKCDAPPCEAVVAELRRVRDAIPSDPLCDPSLRVRVIIAQDPLLDVPVAAAAWGWTYKAQCVDEPSMIQFAKDHYAQGPENFCTPGRTFD
jgi:hypothetical protein